MQLTLGPTAAAVPSTHVAAGEHAPSAPAEASAEDDDDFQIAEEIEEVCMRMRACFGAKHR